MRSIVGMRGLLVLEGLSVDHDNTMHRTEGDVDGELWQCELVARKPFLDQGDERVANSLALVRVVHHLAELHLDPQTSSVLVVGPVLIVAHLDHLSDCGVIEAELCSVVFDELRQTRSKLPTRNVLHAEVART